MPSAESEETMTTKKDAMFHSAASEVVTPFTKDGEIDGALLSDEIGFMLDKGVAGIFVNGLASEFLMLTEKERRFAADTVIRAAAGRVPVVGNIYANSTAAALEQAAMYKELGADAVMIFTPYIYPYTRRGMFEYCDAIGRLCGLPVYICNAYDSINKFPPSLVAEIFAKNPAFRGYKDGTQNIIEQQRLIDLVGTDRHFELIAGSDAQIVTTMMLGGLGVISLITVVFPELIVKTVAAAESGDFKEATRLQAKVIRVREGIKKGPFMAAYKYVARKTGHPLGYMRHPLIEVSAEDAEAIDAVMISENMY